MIVRIVVSIHLMLFFINRQWVLPESYRRFNTSHVILYPGAFVGNGGNSTVSIHLMLFFILNRKLFRFLFFRFNTSHVILYRVLRSESHIYNIVSIHLMLFFIGRSICRIYGTLGVSIHLMLFFICEYKIHLKADDSFNTSHVILYLLQVHQPMSAFQVSIHLMLFFIGEQREFLASVMGFQYISCYSLSGRI